MKKLSIMFVIVFLIQSSNLFANSFEEKSAKLIGQNIDNWEKSCLQIIDEEFGCKVGGRSELFINNAGCFCDLKNGYSSAIVVVDKDIVIGIIQAFFQWEEPGNSEFFYQSCSYMFIKKEDITLEKCQEKILQKLKEENKLDILLKRTDKYDILMSFEGYAKDGTGVFAIFYMLKGIYK